MPMNDRDTTALAAVILLLGLAAAGWYFRDDLMPPDEEATAELPEPTADDTAAADGPQYPLAPLAPRPSADGDLVPLPALDDSDGYFLLEISDLFGPNLRNLLVNEALIDKFVATVDNLPRSEVSERVRPVSSLTTDFAVADSDTAGPFYLGTENYARYDLLVAQVTGARLDDVLDMYRRFYPLFQESYERLGYPNAYFNDRVVEVIDHLLDTPEPTGPIQLVRPNVLYKFADSRLESLSSGQKLL